MDLKDWLIDKRNPRQIPRRLEDCGYTAVRNDSAKDGPWPVWFATEIVPSKPGGTPTITYCARRQTLYARTDISDRMAKATAFATANKPKSSAQRKRAASTVVATFNPCWIFPSI